MKTRKTLYCVLDTETRGGAACPNGVYNAGGKIIDNTGKTYATFNYLVAEYFETIIEQAHYGKKTFPRYLEMLDAGEITVVASEAEMLDMIDSLLSFYNVQFVLAYNTAFDLVKTSLCHLIDNRQFIDIWQMAYEIYIHRPSYRKFCIENRLLTRAGNPKQSVEAMYAFLMNNPMFQEEHTAFSDASQEAEIFLACLRQHKKYTKNFHRGIIFEKYKKKGE